MTDKTSQILFDFDKSFNIPVIGTDEAGRGPAAGGVYVAAVYFDKVSDGLIKDLSVLNDSKKLTPKKRDSIYDIIKNNTINEIVCIEVNEIESINILNASLKGMRLACESVLNKIDTKNVLTLVDGNKLIHFYQYPQQYVVKGDSKSASIAAASVLAKVTRDRYMENLDKEFPMYNWRKNAGYLTAEHLKAIDKYGEEHQLIVAMEEMSELIKELSKNIRGEDNVDKIIEELADCEIMFEQIKIIFKIRKEEILNEKERKIKRLLWRLALPKNTDFKKTE